MQAAPALDGAVPVMHGWCVTAPPLATGGTLALCASNEGFVPRPARVAVRRPGLPDALVWHVVHEPDVTFYFVELADAEARRILHPAYETRASASGAPCNVLRLARR
jgi:hypothetical protein